MITLPVTPCLCETRHATYLALATCLWPDAAQVAGEGPYVLVSTPRPGAHPTVLLWPWVDDALDAKLQLDEAAHLFKTPATNRIHYLRPDTIEPNHLAMRQEQRP